VLTDIIGELLPSALAVALSPVPVIAVVVVLGTPQARTAGPAFALGWIGGLLAVSALVVLVLDGGSDPDGDDPGVGWLKVAIAMLFFVLAGMQWKKRPETGQQAEMPTWMATLGRATPLRTAMFGAALSGANPKNLALTLAAAASIAEASADRADTAIAIAAFIAVGSVAVVGPVLFHSVAPDRAARPLGAVKQFMTDNNAVIMMVILLLLGANLFGDGVATLRP
jgi:threonine/homoserine/homoserine lactone efflux protein